MRVTNLEKIKTLSEFMKEFNPDKQLEVCQSEEDCFFGVYPTLKELVIRYGTKAAIAWLYVQIFDLSEYCGCKEKLTEHQIEECASIIALRYSYLKISELMYYFVNFKEGMYGRFYGIVDPMIITTGLKDFLKQRTLIYEKHVQKLEEKKLKKHKPISYQEYLKLEGKKAEKTPIEILQESFPRVREKKPC